MTLSDIARRWKTGALQPLEALPAKIFDQPSGIVELVDGDGLAKARRA